MDRLAVHVIATAALTLTLATVPVLFADACHASSSAVPPTATRAATHASSTLALAPAIAVLPALSDQAQTQAAEASAADAAFAPPAAPGPAPTPSDRGAGSGRMLLLDLPVHPCVDAHPAARVFSRRHLPTCHVFFGHS
jgi:hypothetical protein